MEFKYPYNIIFLVLAIAATVFFVLAFGKKEKILALFHLDFKTHFKVLRSILLCAGLLLFVFSLLGPQVFAGYSEAAKKGLDIYVLIDTSKSMLVSDIKPDRMTVAKKIIGSLLDNSEGDRIGFIPFAANAYIQMPLTDDYSIAKMFLDSIDTDMVSGGGTNIAAAIKLAGDSFERTSSSDSVILILSDGEEHETDSQNAIKNITDEKIKIFTIGIGTEKGGLVPVYNDDGSAVVDYMKDPSGNTVTSRLEAEIMKKIAQDGNGAYFQATLQGNETTALLNELSKLKRGTLSTEKIKRFTPLYQYFLGSGILLFAIAWLLPERRKFS